MKIKQLILLLILSFALCLSRSTAVLAQSSPVLFNGHYYEYVPVATEWTSANAAASSMTYTIGDKTYQGHLVTITSLEENVFIYNSILSSHSSMTFWIGATDATIEGVWQWVTGEPWGYTNWNYGEPNNYGGNENYAMIFGLGKWNDGADQGYVSTYGYIVEYETGSPGTPASPVYFDGHYYECVMGATDWTSANAAASSMTLNGWTGHLVTLTSPEENDFIYNTFVAAYNDHPLWDAFWIGGYQTNKNDEPAGNWAWLTGESWGYTNWASIEPTNTYGIEDYLVMYGNSDYPGKWGDVANNTVWKLGYIVEYESNDNLPPTIVAPANITTEANNADGAAVTFEATASDDVGPVTITYTQNPGTVFPLGTTTVTCTATDGAGNAAAAVFTVTVVDTTPPVITTPANITSEATSPDGAVVTFTAPTATDFVDGAVSVDCTSDTSATASGDTFPIGVTTMTCTAKDLHNNSVTAVFIITVQDTVPPTITVPANITEEATGANGAVVTFLEATAIDAVGPVTLDYSRVSGSTFPLGTTIVNCTATDAYGNRSSGSFIITVNYDFNGFFKPIDMDGIVNVVKAGSAIPIKFTLGGDMGLDIFAGGYPKSFRVAGFEAGSEFDNIEEIVTTGNSGLSYDPVTGQYTYVWKTDKSWAGTCRQLSVKFADGTEAPLANFKFSK
jgi:hypothetical protein